MVGCSISWTIFRCFTCQCTHKDQASCGGGREQTCGSLNTSSRLFTGLHGTPTDSNAVLAKDKSGYLRRTKVHRVPLIQCALVLVAKTFSSSETNSVLSA
jgi:hypothetical protein